MNHVEALVMKFIMIAVVMGIIASGIFGAKLSIALWISLVLTIVAYLAGDLLIFRTMFHDSDYVKRNATATIADFVLSFVVIYFMGKGLFVNDQDLLKLTFFSAIVIASGEWFFHRYLDDHIFEENQIITGLPINERKGICAVHIPFLLLVEVNSPLI